MHGPQHMHAETWPHWTSETDVSQQLPEWHHACSHGPLTTTEPSDGRSATTFQKWSSQGPCSRLQSQMDHQQHQPIHMHKMSRAAETTNACGLATHGRHQHSLRGPTHNADNTCDDTSANDYRHDQHVECLLPMLKHDQWFRATITKAMMDHLYGMALPDDVTD